MRTSSLLIVALLSSPLPALAQGPLDTILGLRVSGGRPGGAVGATVEETTAALRRAGVPVRCDGGAWVSDEAGVERRQCTHTFALSGHDALLVLNFVRYRLPNVPRAAQLDNVSLSAPSDGGFRGRVARAVQRRHGAPEMHGGDRRWHPASRWIVLDDPSNQPCGGLCVPVVWVFGEHNPLMARFGF